ncbi:MAG: glycosyltransferase [Gemmatimonadales bacterium]
MHIVQVGKFYPPEYHGGLESVVVSINDELVRRGVAVTTVVAAVKGGTRRDTWRGVEVVRAGTLGAVFSQPLAPGYARAVRDATGDLLNLHHPNPLGDWAVLRDKRPLVITQESDIVRQRVLRPLYGPLLRRAFARARAVAVASEQQLTTSFELRGFEAKTRVIPYGIDAAPFAMTPVVQQRVAALRAAWGARPVVLAVGRLVGYKGFDVLLRAAVGLEATVVIVGRGPEEARLRALAGPHTVFAGRVSDGDLVAHYHACDVFCLPSVTIAEAFGVVLLEAMACGRPLVTTSLPTGVSAINRDGVTGLAVPPGKVGALREALSSLLNDAALRKKMGDAARAVQAAEYSAALMGERYLAMYREALQNAD